MVHARRRQQPAAPLRQQRGLLLVGHREGVDLVRRDPRLLGVHRLSGQLHPLVGAGGLDHLRGELRHRHRLRGDPGGRVQGQIHSGREAPRTAVHDPDGIPEVGVVRRSRGPGVPEPPGRAAHPLEPEVRMLGPERTRACERGVREGPQRKRREGFVDGMRHGGLPAVVACRIRSCRGSGSADHRRRSCAPLSVGTRQGLPRATVGARLPTEEALPIGFR